MSPIFMALLLLAGWGVFGYSAWRRWRLLCVGGPENRLDRCGDRVRATLRYAVAQFRMRRYPVAGAAHMVIFLGFGVLLLRTLILWGRGFDTEFNFWIFEPTQTLGKAYSLLKDVFAVLVILGALVFLYYRTVRRLGRLTLNREGLVILGIIVTMMVADIVYDGASRVHESRVAAVRAGAGLAHAGPAPAFSLWEPAGSVVQYAIQGLPDGGVNFLRHLGFWTHSTLVLIFLNLLPYSKHFHIITAVPNVFSQELRPPGRLAPIADIEGKLERGETLGIRRIEQFSWKSMLDFYTCTECGRCSDHCPAAKTGKKLSPKHFTVDLRNFLYENEVALVAEGTAARRHGGTVPSDEATERRSDKEENGAHRKDLVDGVIDPEVLWACTSCRACEQECPVFITYVDKIVDMRRYLVQERGEFPSQLQAAFRGLESNANPWSFAPEDRAAWADGLGVKTMAEHPEAAVLFWVGCSPSFDDRSKKIARATAQLMQKAGVDFAILGTEERCTGDPARRAGNEFLFQMLAESNVEVLNGYGADKKKIVTTCPHCFNTLLNEYPDFGGRYQVVHHTTLLAELVSQGKIRPTKSVEKKVVFHDSCYLGRYNEVYDPPREMLKSIPGLTLLEPVQTRDRGMCCGAGGAQMFKEEEHGTQRVNALRTEQLLDTKPDAISSACPFCMSMLTDGLAEKHRDDVAQLDVAELLWDAVS